MNFDDRDGRVMERGTVLDYLNDNVAIIDEVKGKKGVKKKLREKNKMIRMRITIGIVQRTNTDQVDLPNFSTKNVSLTCIGKDRTREFLL